ncbi:pilus assembly protein PilM [bacterium]|nr:pilus assembly protein PilM [bacterium]
MNKKIIGLDISDSTIEISELSLVNGLPRVVSLGRTKIEAGIVLNGVIKEYAHLAKAVKRAMTEARPKPISNGICVFGLPTAITYIYFFTATMKYKEGKTELDERMRRVVEANIPIAMDKVAYEYRVIGKKREEIGKNICYEIILAATYKKLLEEWGDFLKSIGLPVKFFDLEPIALAQGLGQENQDSEFCIADLGARSTDVSIYSNRKLIFVYRVYRGGARITEKIAKEMHIDQRVAEDMKIKAKIGERKNSGAEQIIKVELMAIFKEVLSAIDYARERFSLNFENIFLAGGVSKTQGILEVFNLMAGDYEIRKAQSLTREKKPVEYIEAIGLGVRGLEKEVEKESLVFLPTKQSRIRSEFKLSEARSLIKKNFNQYRVKAITIFSLFIFVMFMFLISVIWHSNKKIKNQIEPVKVIVSTTTPEAKKNILSSAINEEKIKIVNINTNLNIRSGPGTEYGVLGKAILGEEYVLIKELESWNKIKFISGEGWIFANFTEKITDSK